MLPVGGPHARVTRDRAATCMGLHENSPQPFRSEMTGPSWHHATARTMERTGPCSKSRLPTASREACKDARSTLENTPNLIAASAYK